MSIMSLIETSNTTLRPAAPSFIPSPTTPETNPRSVPPLKIFPSIEEFVRRHKEGTEAEFAAEQKRVDDINKEHLTFRAWVLLKIRQTAKRSEYLVIVDPGRDERKIAQQGEPARLRIVFNDKSVTRFFDARRVESSMASAVTACNLEMLAVYQVTVHVSEAHKGVKPLVTEHSNDEESTLQGLATDLVLGDDNAVGANFLLTASESTKNAELAAINQLYGKHANATERQIQAFEYFVLFRSPKFTVDLHQQMPHMWTAMKEPTWPESGLAQKYDNLNYAQKEAYEGFRKLKCGLCILPGGPGAGKTHFNLFTIAMAQSKPLESPVRACDRGEKRFAKVLFMVDMNSPVDDVANRVVRLYNELGMKKSVIRMKGWGAEVALSDRLNAAEDEASGDPITVDFTNQFLRTANLMLLGDGSNCPKRSCNAPSLDEAAWQYYDDHKNIKYEELTKFLKGELWEESEVIPLRFRRSVYHLYRDTLAAADFIATTPVAASNHFRGLFKPDLVFFDESPHARELSNLIAIANFNPIAWVFCGDYRQTVPYVGSDSPGCRNIYRPQMQISMMERAAVACAIQHELLINHRAFGGLEDLASRLWYGGQMRGANARQTAPPSLEYIQKFLERFVGDWGLCTVPRLLVHVRECGAERRDGTSAWNPDHATWVMARVRELLNAKDFKRADRDEAGTILIISPYRKAYQQYRNEIKKLPGWAQSRVETRTVDVVQGHEADVVFVDLVKEASTDFLDNPNRLCVALTRARQGEIIIMHPKMVQSANFKTSYNLRRIYDLCAEKEQVVFVEKEWTTATVLGRQPDSPTESRATSPAQSTITSMVTSTGSISDQPTSPARPVTPPKGLAASVHTRTDSATTTAPTKPTPPVRRAKSTPTVADKFRTMARVSKLSAHLASDGVQDWLNEMEPKSLLSEFGYDVEKKLTIRNLPAEDVGKNDGARSEGEKVEGEKVEGEKVEGEKFEGEKVEGEKTEGEKTETERVMESDGVASVGNSGAATTASPPAKLTARHPWTRPRVSR